MSKGYLLSGFLATLGCLVLLASCTSHNPSGTTGSGSMTTLTPNPVKTPYLGIKKMWKGHVQAIDRNVLIVWVNPSPGLSSSETAYNTFRQIEPLLHRSDLQVAIIKVDLIQNTVGAFGPFYTKTAANVYIKAENGSWGPIHDETMLDKIIRAGL